MKQNKNSFAHELLQAAETAGMAGILLKATTRPLRPEQSLQISAQAPLLVIDGGSHHNGVTPVDHRQ